MSASLTMVGHNNPPSDEESLVSKLQLDNEDLLNQARAAYKAALEFSEEVSDREKATEATDLISKLASIAKKLDGEREKEKKPYLSLGRVVDNFFKNVTDPLDGAKRKVKGRLDDFLRRAAEEERKVREEQARKMREEAERKAAEAVALESINSVVAANT